MTFTYSSSNLSSSGLSKVRFLVGDTDTGVNDQLLDDAEINWLIDTESGIYNAASAAATAIASKFSRQADKSVGDLSISASQKAKAYLDMARELKRKAAIFAPVNIFAGGISKASKDTYEQDSDRVKPAFTRTLHDYVSLSSSC